MLVQLLIFVILYILIYIVIVCYGINLKISRIDSMKIIIIKTIVIFLKQFSFICSFAFTKCLCASFELSNAVSIL